MAQQAREIVPPSPQPGERGPAGPRLGGSALDWLALLALAAGFVFAALHLLAILALQAAAPRLGVYAGMIFMLAGVLIGRWFREAARPDGGSESRPPEIALFAAATAMTAAVGLTLAGEPLRRWALERWALPPDAALLVLWTPAALLVLVAATSATAGLRLILQRLGRQDEPAAFTAAGTAAAAAFSAGFAGLSPWPGFTGAALLFGATVLVLLAPATGRQRRPGPGGAPAAFRVDPPSPPDCQEQRSSRRSTRLVGGAIWLAAGLLLAGLMAAGLSPARPTLGSGWLFAGCGALIVLALLLARTVLGGRGGTRLRGGWLGPAGMVVGLLVATWLERPAAKLLQAPEALAEVGQLPAALLDVPGLQTRVLSAVQGAPFWRAAATSDLRARGADCLVLCAMQTDGELDERTADLVAARCLSAVRPGGAVFLRLPAAQAAGNETLALAEGLIREWKGSRRTTGMLAWRVLELSPAGGSAWLVIAPDARALLTLCLPRDVPAPRVEPISGVRQFYQVHRGSR